MNHEKTECFQPIAWASQVVPLVKNPSADAGDKRLGSIPGSGISLGGRHGNPLQYSYFQNPTDRGAWLATAHGLQRDMTEATTYHAHSQLHSCSSLGTLLNLLSNKK